MEIKEKYDIVYFIQNGDDNGYIKIGFTNDLKARLIALQTGNPYELRVLHIMAGGLRLEQVIHNKFEHLRVNKEWFRPEKELLDYIELCKDPKVQEFLSQTYQLNFAQVKQETKELIDNLSKKIVDAEYEFDSINLEKKNQLTEYCMKVLAKYNTLFSDSLTYKSVGERQQKPWRELRGAIKSCLDRFEKIITKQ